MKNYPLVVIGGGISGLSTAIAWLKNRDGPVLVLEKEAVPGGCVASFSRQGYRFDTVQLIPDMGDLLEYLGVGVSLTRFEGTLSRLFLARQGEAPRSIAIPADAGQFERDLMASWPNERKKIERFFATCRAMVSELAYLTLEPTIADIARIMVKCPHIIRHSGDTWKRFLGRFGFREPELVETLDLFSSYAGLSGDRCAALLTVSAMTTALAGSSRPSGAFVTLPDAMRRRVIELGGEVRVGCRAERILFNADGSVRGVLATGAGSAGGEEILADTVVSTVDTGVFLGKLIGENRLRAVRGPYRTALARLEMSPSMLAVHLGLDGAIDLKGLGLDGAYNVLTAGREAHEAAFRGDDADDRRFHLAFYSPSLATGAERQTLVVHASPVSAKPWIELRARDADSYARVKDAAARRYVGILERELIPNLSRHVSLMDVATPATVGRYLGSPTGSCFDMMPTLAQFGLNRLPLRTPFPGLFHTKFSHGIWAAMHAGLQVIDLVTDGAVMNGGARYVARKG